MDETTVARIDARLAALEAQVSALRSERVTAEPIAAQPKPEVPPRADVRRPAPVAPPGSERARDWPSLETLLAGRGLQFAGLLLILFGAAYFFDLAVTRGWIGPGERVLLGLAIGAGLIVFAATRIGPAYVLVAESLVGVGAGILYLALWSAVGAFAAIPGSRVAVFAAMIAVTATLGALAATRRSERLAFLGALGGYLTPLLIANGSTDHVVFAGYIAILTGGMLALGARYAFVSIEILTLVCTVAFAGAFVPDPQHGWTSLDAQIVATILFAIFAAAFSTGVGTATKRRAGLLVAITSAYIVIEETLFGANQTILGADLLGLAAVLLVAAQIAKWPKPILSTYGALALGSVTLALAAFFRELTLVDALAVEATILAYVNRQLSDLRLNITSFVLLAFSGMLLVNGSALLPHARAIEIAVAFAIWLGAAMTTRRFVTFAKPELAASVRISVDIVALTGLSRACVDIFGGNAGMGASSAQVAISLVWTLYATVLFGIGLRRERALLRWEGLALFAATIIKVFTIDLSNVDVEFRVGTFVLLGAVLFGVSTWYTRAMARPKPETPPA